MGDVNWLAVAASTVVGFFLLGGLWYSKGVFGMTWGRAAGFVDAQGNITKPKVPGSTSPKHPGSVFAFAFLFAAIAAVAFDLTLPDVYSLKDAVVHGAIVGLGFVATSLGINYQFAARGTTLWLVDAGYHGVQFLLYGLIFGLLR
jgi:hypothetical protein